MTLLSFADLGLPGKARVRDLGRGIVYEVRVRNFVELDKGP